ncbi:hypothetical protein [Streptomyces specialis]|uniref:hypothetical protein n=1 Tax=Streptomyces specialis TaxID=498367 RepID=UPI000B0DD2BE|nr:hypothetical protein [Streptomyces specialis]
MSEKYSVFTAPRGGVMTKEVGVITGELELHTRAGQDGSLSLRVRYAGADEWYTPEGGPYTLHDPRDHEVVHEVVIDLLHRPPLTPASPPAPGSSGVSGRSAGSR